MQVFNTLMWCADDDSQQQSSDDKSVRSNVVIEDVLTTDDDLGPTCACSAVDLKQAGCLHTEVPGIHYLGLGKPNDKTCTCVDHDTGAVVKRLHCRLCALPVQDKDKLEAATADGCFLGTVGFYQPVCWWVRNVRIFDSGSKKCFERMRRVDMRVEYGVRAYDGYSEYDDDRYDKYDRAAMRGAVKHEKTFAEHYFESKALRRQGAKAKQMRGNDFRVAVKANASNGGSKSSSGSLNSRGNSKVPQVQHLEHACLSRVHSGSNVDGFVNVIDAATVENEAYRRVAFDKFAVGDDHESEEQRCADFAVDVDITNCAVSGAGAAQLSTTWTDPSFDKSQPSFYYLRVLENPTCRWSTWDAIRNGVPPRAGLATQLQERAWSSPVWFDPSDRR